MRHINHTDYRASQAEKRRNGPTRECECGCGVLIPVKTVLGKPARFVLGHNARVQVSGRFTEGQLPWNTGLKLGPSPKRGTTVPTEAIEKRTATRRANYNGGYVSPDRGKGNPKYIGRERPERATSAGGTRKDLGRYFRSRWEANYARYLNSIGCTWLYEPSVFRLTLADGSERNYRPDFLVDGSHFVELKGFDPEGAALTLAAAATQLPKPLTVILKPEYSALERRVGSTINGWEFPKSARPSDNPHRCPTCDKPTKVQTQKYCSRKCQPHPFAGRYLSDEAIARRTATRIARYGAYFSYDDH